MSVSLRDFIKAQIPLSQAKKTKLDRLREALGGAHSSEIASLYRSGKIDVIYSRYGISTQIAEDPIYPEIVLKANDDNTKKLVSELNTIIKENSKKTVFREFSKSAQQKILGYIAPGVYGLEHVREAVLLQMFSTEPVHILLLGDRGTGKTSILKSVSVLHPAALYGTCTGSIGVSVHGDRTVKGILPLSNNGLCCIDGLNTDARETYNSLYSAMDKGVVSYDRLNRRTVLDANVRILAAADPNGEFVGKTIEVLRQQIPFDNTLLPLFHLVFMIRKSDSQGFVHTTKKIIESRPTIEKRDLDFIREYVNFAESITCEFPKEYKDAVVAFVNRLRKKEQEYLVGLSPGIVLGLVRLCKARARMNLRNAVNKEDIDKVASLLENSLIVRRK